MQSNGMHASDQTTDLRKQIHGYILTKIGMRD